MSVSRPIYWLSLVLACIAATTGVERASAETVALIGTGNVGSTLGRRFAEQGHTVVYGSPIPRPRTSRRWYARPRTARKPYRLHRPPLAAAS